MAKSRMLSIVEAKTYTENQGVLWKRFFLKINKQRTSLPAIRAIQIAKSVVLMNLLIGHRITFSSCDQSRGSYLGIGQLGSLGRHIGSGPPSNAFDPAGQLTPGLQGGIGSPENPSSPNAIPSTTTKAPKITFAFTCLSMPRVAASGTDSMRRSARQNHKIPVLYATS